MQGLGTVKRKVLMTRNGLHEGALSDAEILQYRDCDCAYTGLYK